MTTAVKGLISYPSLLSPSRWGPGQAGPPGRAFVPVFRRFSGRCSKLRHSHQVIGGGHEVSKGLRSFDAPVAAAPQAANDFNPADDLLHPLADTLADGVSRLPGGAPIQLRHLEPFLAGDMRQHLPLPATGGRQNRVWPPCPWPCDRGRSPGRLCSGVCRYSAFPRESQWSDCRGPPLLPPRSFFIRAVPADEALQAGPRFNQGAVGGKVFVAGPFFLAGELIDFGKEEAGHLRREHALIILGEGAVVEAALGKLPVQKPKPEQIVGELLAAHRVKGDEHAGLEELFGRNAGASLPSIELVKQGRELLEHDVHAALDLAQRMVGRHALVEIDDGQKLRLGLRFSTHACSDAPIHNWFQLFSSFSTSC